MCNIWYTIYMRIISSKFVTSVANKDKILIDDKSQIAFVGRSNVGKSSLLNMLCGNSKLAKTSSTPGRTRLVNYFLINNDFYFVDLPGYGYAKASKSEVYSWQKLLEPYLIDNPRLKCVCVLVDIRHDPTELDEQMISFLNYYQIPYIIVATKADKFGKSKIKPMASKMANCLKVASGNVYPISSINSYGKENLLDKIEQFLQD